MHLLVSCITHTDIACSGSELFQFEAGLVGGDVGDSRPLSAVGGPFEYPSAVFAFRQAEVEGGGLFLQFPGKAEGLSRLDTQYFVQAVVSDLVFAFLQRLIFQLFDIRQDRGLTHLGGSICLVCKQQVASDT